MSDFKLKEKLKANELHSMKRLSPEPTPSGDVHDHPNQDNLKTMADDEYGIKELMEILDGAEALAVGTIKRLRDGFQITDAASLAADEDLRGDVREAMEGISDTPLEVGELSRQEIFTLTNRALEITQNIFAALVE